MGKTFAQIAAVATRLALAGTREEAIRIALVDGLHALRATGGAIAELASPTPAEGDPPVAIVARVSAGVIAAEIAPRAPGDELLLEVARTAIAREVRRAEARRFAVVPLRAWDRPSGALGAELEPDVGDADDDVLRAMELLGDHLAAALLRARMTSEREARIEALIRDAALQRDVLDLLPLIIWIRDLRSGSAFLSSRASAFTGVPAEDLLRSWAGIVHPDDLPALEAMALSDSWQLEYRIRGADGDYRWFLARSELVRDGRGERVARFGCAIDVDTQRRARDGHRFLAHAGDVLASSLDARATLATLARLAVPLLADWCVVDAVSAGGDVARVAVARPDGEDESVVRELTESHPPPSRIASAGGPILVRDVASASAELPADLAEIGARLSARSAIVTYARGASDEIVRTALFTTRPARSFDEDDLALASELTRRAGNALEHAQLYGEAQQANQTKDVFLATVSHELRGPLAAISMWTHVLALEPRDEATHARALESIGASVRAQSRLIDDLIDLSRSIAGKLRMELVPLAIESVVRLAVGTALPTAAAKGVTLEVTCKDAGLVVRGDAGRLMQALGNVISNAIDFSPRGGRIDVTLARARGASRIEVTDTGDGIGADFLPHVFEPFRQEGASLTRARGGLGLGLAVARQIVHLHGGIIRAASAGRGAGSTFAIELPTTKQATVDGGQGPSSLLRGARVVVVDDDAAIRDGLVLLLTQYGATVRAAASVREAIALFDAWLPDVIVSDIAMPEEDGYALMAILRARPPERGGAIPALALTAHAGRARAMAAGFQRHLSKPVDAAELAIALGEMLDPSITGRAPGLTRP